MSVPTRMRLLLVCALVSLYAASPANATTYEPVTFTQLVEKADVIFIGDVVDVRPYVLRTRDASIIKTRVTFRVDDPIYGTKSLLEVFDFLGGEMNGVGMAVAGMPKFAVGDHRIVFARRDRSINPIVGFSQGLIEVQRDANGVERVMTRGRAASFTRGASMRLIDFRARIAAAVAEAHPR